MAAGGFCVSYGPFHYIAFPKKRQEDKKSLLVARGFTGAEGARAGAAIAKNAKIPESIFSLESERRQIVFPNKGSERFSSNLRAYGWKLLKELPPVPLPEGKATGDSAKGA